MSVAQAPTIEGDWEAWQVKWPYIAAGPNAELFSPIKPRPEDPRFSSPGEYESYCRSWFSHQHYFGRLWERIDGKGFKRFIELGAGRATTSQYLAAHALDITLVDLVPIAMELARKNFVAHGFAEPRMIEADVQDTGEPDGSYHCVHSVGLLEHFEHPRRVLLESMRLLKPGGLMQHVIVQGKDRPDHPGMKRTKYSVEQWSDWAEDAGAIDVKCERCLVRDVLVLSGRRPRP